MASTINAKNTSTGVVITPDASGQLELQTADTTRMTIDVNGNVGVGTSSPSFKFVSVGGGVQLSGGTTSQAGLRFQQSSGVATITGINNDNNAFNPISFFTGSSEAMRIDSSGNVLVNQTGTSSGADGKLSSTSTASSNQPAATFKSSDGASQYTTVVYNAATSGNNQFILFGTEGTFTSRGGITYNRVGGLTAYNTTSDQRLKENIVDASSALSKIDSVKIRSFDWKETGNHVDFGVIAQELNEVAPECVTPGEDNEDGSIKNPWAVDTSALVPAMIKAIQELKAELDTVKAELATLKGTA